MGRSASSLDIWKRSQRVYSGTAGCKRYLKEYIISIYCRKMQKKYTDLTGHLVRFYVPPIQLRDFQLHCILLENHGLFQRPPEVRPRKLLLEFIFQVLHTNYKESNVKLCKLTLEIIYMKVNGVTKGNRKHHNVTIFPHTLVKLHRVDITTA